MKCELVRISNTYKDKKGNDRVGNDYYLEFENGEFIAITAKWTKDKDGKFNDRDLIRLRAFSTLKERN